MKEELKRAGAVLLLTLAALPLGAAAGAVDALFGRVLLALSAVRTAHALWLLPLLGLAGAAAVLCVRRFGGRSARGMSLIFEAGHGGEEAIPLRLVPVSIGSTWLTHLFGGSAGREGVAVQIGGALGGALGARLPGAESRRLLVVAGMAAGFAGLFRTPVAATFFALEVLSCGVLEVGAALPALAAALTASRVAGLLGLERFSAAPGALPALTWRRLLALVLLALAFGAVGRAFAAALAAAKAAAARRIPDPVRRILLLGTVIGLCSLLCAGGRYSGLGTNLIALGLAGAARPWDFALKLLFTAATLAAGFQGGEVTPLFAVGASLGAVLAPLLGLPAALGAALGYAAVFGSATNTLLAPMLIGAEVFGWELLPVFCAVCTLAYVCNGDRSIYPLQRRRGAETRAAGK